MQSIRPGRRHKTRIVINKSRAKHAIVGGRLFYILFFYVSFSSFENSRVQAIKYKNIAFMTNR